MRVGELPEIARLCRGAARQRPSQPRYHSTWDVNQMLLYISSIDENNNLPLGKLTRKLTMLLALATGGRSSDLLSYHTHVIEWSSSGVTLAKNIKGKSSEAGKRVFHPLHETKELCIPSCLRAYIDYTKEFRGGEKTKNSQLLLSICKPIPPVKSSTVAR